MQVKLLIRPLFLLTLFIMGSFFSQAQTKMNDYKSQWDQIEKFMEKGLPQSAAAEVDKIYVSAKKTNNEPQIIKALLFKISLDKNVKEDADEKAIQELEKEILNSKEPAKSILQSITAQMYWDYFQNNRYKIYQLTNTVNFEKKDIATWTADDFSQKITELYLASLKNISLLQSTKLAPYDAIIKKGNARELRPTLFDLLAHRALDYFKNDERNITKPSYSFVIDNPNTFAPAQQFIQINFKTKDSASLQHKALLLFQQLLAFHLNDTKKDALLDVDIERLNFINQYGVMPDKDELYIAALKNLSVKFSNNPASSEATFLMANTIYQKALELSDDNKSDSNYTVKNAKIILEKLVKQFPKSNGGIQAQNVLTEILKPQLSFTTEKVNVPNTSFRSLVTFKNISQIFCRIIPFTDELKQNKKLMSDNEYLLKLSAQKSIESWAQPLPITTDYLSHSTEIKINGLPVGEYILLSSNEDNFNLGKNIISAQNFYVSNISYINNNNEYFILDRTTGKPLGGASVQVWSEKYDYDSRKYKVIKEEKVIADKNGFFKLSRNKNDKRNSNVKLEINYDNDHLFLDDLQYVYYNFYEKNDTDFKNQKEFDKVNAKVFLFTDRSIYRPGQTVYFKGIGVTKDYITKKSILLQNKDSLKVYFHDANSQKIDSMNVVLNDFGSFNGKFRIPENKLNGFFSIQVNINNYSFTSFSVEEYKRPKFYTEFEKPKGSYRLMDTVVVTGFAKAYAGNNIDGALVKYKVRRVARFLYPWMFWRKGFPTSSPMEISHGEITTDENGQFSIRFVAIPDRSLDKSTSPVFDYTVEADVTDINGETRSTTILIPVGYQSLNLQITIPKDGVINKDSLKNISISSKNLSGEPEPVNADIKIYQLKTPERLIRQRLWEEPDLFVMSKNEFIQYFPHDEYMNETQKESWDKGALVLEKSETISNNFQLPINKQLSQGWYVIEATAKDKYGEVVKDQQYFQVYDAHSSSLPAMEYVWSNNQQKSLEPGDTAKIITGTSAKEVYLISQVNRPIDSTVYNFSSISNDKKEWNYFITEKDRGGFGVNQFFVKDNRFYFTSNTISVPWSNKELNISFDTYRDKTLPGSEEKWKVKITGNKGEKVAAEMLASMYDASLDQFKPHSWNRLNIWPTFYNSDFWRGKQNFSTVNSVENYVSSPYVAPKEIIYDELDYLPNKRYNDYLVVSESSKLYGSQKMESKSSPPNVNTVQFSPPNIVKDEEVVLDSASLSEVVVISSKNEKKSDPSQIQIRKNFNETAFFFPELRTDSAGNIEFSFTMPEALTQWKLMALAHTKDLASGYSQKTVITQKELMVQPNPPRFLREGDRMEFTAKIVNLGDKEVTGQSELQLLNATTMNPVDGWFKNIFPLQYFTIAAGQSALVTFNIEIPNNFNSAVVYRIIAKAGNVSDGEEASIPVVTNRMLVTETMTLPMRGNSSKDFKLDKLIQSGNSETLTNYGLTVEYTTNPAWYAIQALPYLMEYPYECVEQTFNRFYANSLAMKIVNSSPKIKAVFEKWNITDTAALMSNLQKNEELKSVLLQETPWILDAQNEAQQKKNIALLFDAVKMSQQLETSLQKLKDMQSSNGGFTWFKGGPDNRYMTQYIVSGIGHLIKLNAIPTAQENAINQILIKALPYLDNRMQEDYDNLLKHKIVLSNNNLSTTIVQYLYMRSFFPKQIVPSKNKTAYSYYRKQAKKYWLTQSKYMQGMIALALYRSHDLKAAQVIIQSLKENSINNEELGMYWKEWNRGGYWWYQAPIESQALMIEAFSEIEKDQKTIGDLKTWLLKNKQTNNWKTTKATADAVYALLLQGTDWLSAEKNITIQLGNTKINSWEEKQEAGTGYFKRRIEGDQVKPEMGNITVTVSAPLSVTRTENNTSVTSLSSSNKTQLQLTKKPIDNSPSWGGVYWQYFENLDKITFAETPLKLSKKLFVETNTDKGPVLKPVNDGDNLKVGDKIKVRIELRVDRDMEYVHMKDMRASCMEPTNVISSYKWQSGLGYYETTKDVSTNFFFSYLNKGTYVFEYPMFVTHAGNFSNGITTIQCMYAPEFTAHSEGVRVNVK